MALSRESRALRKSYEVFVSGVDPDFIIKKLYSQSLLTREEKTKAKQKTLTSDEQLDKVFECLERRVSVNPSVFSKLVQMLMEEPALEGVGKTMQACYEEQPEKAQLAKSDSVEATQPEPHDTSLALPDTDRIERVAYEASQLQDMFVTVLTHTKIAFSKEPVEFLSRLQITLTTLPLSSKFKHLCFLETRKEEIENAKNVTEIFKILRRYWNFVDYALLQRIIKDFGDSALQSEMKIYVATLEQFEKKTTIQDFSRAKPGDRVVPYYFSEAIIHLKKDASKCTLYEVRKFVESLANKTCLDQYSVLNIGSSPSSVIIKIAFPRAVLELIIVALKDREFLEMQQIISVTIDRKPLEKYTEKHVKGLQLLRASEEGDEATVTSILQSGMSPNFRHYGSETALHCASRSGHTAVIKLLLDHGANVHAFHKQSKQTALHMTSAKSHHEAMQLLLERGADPNTLNHDGKTAIMMAAKGGHTHIVQDLIARRADINIQDKWGWTAVMMAARRGHALTMKLLIKAGAETNIQVIRGLQLLRASEMGDEATVTSLLQSGVSPNFSDTYGKTALHCASRAGQTAIVKLLLDHGADVHAEDKDQWTTLHTASDRGHDETVHLLLERGAYPNRLNKWEWTAVMMAARGGHTHTVKGLVRGGANPNIQNRYGDTSLMWATLKGHSEAVRALAQNGADLNVQNKEGLTALMLAARRGQTAIVNTLVEGHADANIQENSTGWTAIFFATKEGHLEITRKLIRAGADVLLQDKNGVTALDVARAHGRDVLCEVLIKATPLCESTTLTSGEGTTPLPESTKLQTHAHITSTVSTEQTKQWATTPHTQQSITTALEASLLPNEQTKHGLQQSLRNLVNKSVMTITRMYQELEKRLKSVAEKELFQNKLASNQDEMEGTHEHVHITLEQY